MGTKFAVLDDESDIPSPSIQAERPPTDWRDTMDKIVTVGVLALVAGVIGYGSYLAGGYFNQPTFDIARAEIESVAGPEAAEEFAEQSKACRDDAQLRTACRLLYMDGRPVPSKIASARVAVPND